jgi:DNA-binding transcriptional LysR family regulator
VKIRYFDEYLALVRFMNFTTAAKYLNLTQSALSKHIAALEKEFGCVFFNRNSQYIELTAQGRAFCTDALEISNHYKAAQLRMKSMSLEVRLAGYVDDAAILKLISTARTRLTESDPGLGLSLIRVPSQSLQDLLTAKRIDLYIEITLEGDYVNPSCDTCILAAVPLVAIVNRQHRLATRKTISVSDLASQAIMYPTGSFSSVRGSDAVDSFIHRHNIFPEKSIFFADSIKDFPLADINDNVFVTPRSNFSKQLFSNIMDNYCAIPFEEEDAVFPYHLVWRKDEENARVLNLRDTLIAVSEELYPGNRSLTYQHEQMADS